MSKARTLANAVAAGGAMRLAELAVNGTNTVGLGAPDALAADLTFKLPNTNGSANQALITDGAGNLSWGDVGNKSPLIEWAFTITQSYSLATNKNGLSYGSVKINSGVSVTVPTGSTWYIRPAL